MTTSDITMLDRFQGCLVGGAVGDALGYPVEFMSYDSIRATFGPEGIRSYWLQDGDTALFSDDTQMTLFTAAGLLHAGRDASRGTYVKDIHRSYLDWLCTQDDFFHVTDHLSELANNPQLHSHRAPGNTCLSALRSRKKGLMEKPLNNSRGCGGVMRVAPVGLFFPDADEAAFVAAMAAAITHGHPLAYISAGGLGYMVSQCVYGEASSLADIVSDCIDRLPDLFPDDRWSASEMARQLSQAVDLAQSSAADAECIPILGEGWIGDEALAIAVFAALRHADDFSEAIVCAVNHSGDADSTGAIAGNIVGAWLGLQAIEPRWTSSLELRELILGIAKDLYDIMQD